MDNSIEIMRHEQSLFHLCGAGCLSICYKQSDFVLQYENVSSFGRIYELKLVRTTTRLMQFATRNVGFLVTSGFPFASLPWKLRGRLQNFGKECLIDAAPRNTRHKIQIKLTPDCSKDPDNISENRGNLIAAKVGLGWNNETIDRIR